MHTYIQTATAFSAIAVACTSAQVIPAPGLDDMASAAPRPAPATLVWTATARDQLSTKWEAAEYATNALTGAVATNWHRYTEIGSGLNYPDANGQYQPSQDLIELTPDGGAAALHGPAKLYLKANLNSTGAITFVTAAGRVLRTRPLGIFWYDAQTGQAELVAAVQDCVGELVPPNQVVWKSAFGPIADLRLTYTKGAIESDVILLQRPALPAGWDPRSARLEVWHDWTGAPAPAINPRLLYAETNATVRPLMVEPDLTDQILNFGAGDLWLPTGAAFATEGTTATGTNVARQVRVPDLSGNSALTPVAKTWLATPLMDVLIEAVRWPDVEAKFAGLPLTTVQSSGVLPLDRLGWVAQLPEPSQASGIGQAIRVAVERYEPVGFVLDYIPVPSSYTYDYTFDTGTTYYVGTTTYFSATVTFRPGCIIKFNGNYLLIYGSIVCNGTSGNPSILTSWEEKLFGQIIDGSVSSCPADEASPALWDYYIDADLSINYMRFRWAQTAIRFDANGCKRSHMLSGCTFEECQTGIYANNCTVTISTSTRSNVNAPTAGTGCFSFIGALTDIGSLDADTDDLPDWMDYQYFGRLGTLGGNNAGQLTLWTTGYSPSTDEPIWSTLDNANGRYTYNANCWLYGVKGLTAFSPWHDESGCFWYQGGGTLITRRHAVTVEHMVGCFLGKTVRFVGTLNDTYEATVIGSIRMDHSDLEIMLLDQPMPSTVENVRILTSDVQHKLALYTFNGEYTQCRHRVTPIVAFNQYKEGYITDVTNWNLYNGHPWESDGVNVEHSVWFPSWGSSCWRNGQTCECVPICDVTGGDSGSPLFMLINGRKDGGLNGELVLIGTWSSCCYANWAASLAELNAKIQALDIAVLGQWTGLSAAAYPLNDPVVGFPDLW